MPEDDKADLEGFNAARSSTGGDRPKGDGTVSIEKAKIQADTEVEEKRIDASLEAKRIADRDKERDDANRRVMIIGAIVVGTAALLAATGLLALTIYLDRGWIGVAVITALVITGLALYLGRGLTLSLGGLTASTGAQPQPQPPVPVAKPPAGTPPGEGA